MKLAVYSIVLWERLVFVKGIFIFQIIFRERKSSYSRQKCIFIEKNYIGLDFIYRSETTNQHNIIKKNSKSN